MPKEPEKQPGDESNGPATPRRRPGGRSARIRTAVIAAVMNMLRERGMEGLNVAEIAAQVGIPESTIYRRWRTREELVVESVMEQMSSTLPLPDTGSFPSDLRAMLQESAAFLESPDGKLLTRSMFATMNQTDSQARQSYWTLRFSHTGAVVQRAIERGELRPDADPEVLMTAMTGALYVRLLVLEAPLDQPFLDQFEQIILHGVLKI